MTVVYVVLLFAAAGVGFVAGRVFEAWHIPRLLARMQPDQLRALAARTAKHRRTTT